MTSMTSMSKSRTIMISISMSESSMIQLKVNDKDWEGGVPPNKWAEHLSLSPGQALSIPN